MVEKFAKTPGRSANFDTLQHTEFLPESADFNCAVRRRK
jgi:hypothetical protein